MFPSSYGTLPYSPSSHDTLIWVSNQRLHAPKLDSVSDLLVCRVSDQFCFLIYKYTEVIAVS